MKRICVIVNKWWELDPIMGVLLSDYAHAAHSLPWPTLHRHPRPRPDEANLPPADPNPQARAIFQFGGAAVSVEVWCISDLLEHLPSVDNYQSSTEQKAARIPLIVSSGDPDLTLAVGTAARGTTDSDNGNVVVGSRAFIFNGNPSNQFSKWSAGPFGKVLDSNVSPALFVALTNIEPLNSRQVRQFFMVPPLNPAAAGAIVSSVDQVALSDVNVTDARDYATADPSTIAAFQQLGTNLPFGSIETTHGLIRALCGDNFLFISGITNGVGLFGREVLSRKYAQNTVAAHNAGVILANMLPLLVANV